MQATINASDKSLKKYQLVSMDSDFAPMRDAKTQLRHCLISSQSVERIFGDDQSIEEALNSENEDQHLRMLLGKGFRAYEEICNSNQAD
jgi:predicted nucleotidyltransferase